MAIENIVNRVRDFSKEYEVSIAHPQVEPGSSLYKWFGPFRWLFEAKRNVPAYTADIMFEITLGKKPADSSEILDFEKDVAFLHRMWPRLEKWALWYLESQAGPEPLSFRWHGRSKNAKELNPKTLTSGLDDSPRASHPSYKERHLDLYCWMALMADTMRKIGKIFSFM